MRATQISIHALLAESDPAAWQDDEEDEISIHALLAESDDAVLCEGLPVSYFYPRSPCGERRDALPRFRRLLPDFYPRSPCGERQQGAADGGIDWSFLSTLSLRRATCGGLALDVGHEISIHALLAESDMSSSTNLHGRPRFLSTLSLRRATVRSPVASFPARNFYPRSPCGERRSVDVLRPDTPLFLSTLSLRRATCGSPNQLNFNDISIHALLAESDLFLEASSDRRMISIHALLAESDNALSASKGGTRTFLSTLSLRRATLRNRSPRPH